MANHHASELVSAVLVLITQVDFCCPSPGVPISAFTKLTGRDGYYIYRVLLHATADLAFIIAS